MENMKINFTQTNENIGYGNQYFSNKLTKDAVKCCESISFFEKILYVVLSAGVVTALLFSFKHDSWFFFILSGLSGFVVVYIVKFFIAYVCIRKNQCRIDAEECFRGDEPIELEITGESFKVSTPGVETTYQLDHLAYYVLDDDYMIVAVSKYYGECIPLSVFNTPEEKMEFIKLMDSKVQKDESPMG